MKKQKLELTWIGKESQPKLEPRILLKGPLMSYHAKYRSAGVSPVNAGGTPALQNIFDNLLALEAEFAGKVKCVFIDPPYNNGSALTHYDDGVEHSIWLSLIRDRLEIIRRLLAEDGPLWITGDDNETHYPKVMCDEVFGRNYSVHAATNGGKPWRYAPIPHNVIAVNMVLEGLANQFDAFPS